jgi:hypothetical protein
MVLVDVYICLVYNIILSTLDRFNAFLEYIYISPTTLLNNNLSLFNSIPLPNNENYDISSNLFLEDDNATRLSGYYS